ncbi:hypothetical protein F183_A38800, partial [Bryobacterales bacterium F-183]
MPEVREVISGVNWREVCLNLVEEHGPKGIKNLTRLLQPTQQEEAAKKAAELFTKAFLEELNETGFEFAMDGYRQLLIRFVETAAPFITCWLQPEPGAVDLHLVGDMWTSPHYPPLPEDFDWEIVEKKFGREVGKYVRNTPDLREKLNTALLEQQTELQKRIAGPDLGFDLAGYRTFLHGRCRSLSLATLHKTAYDRKIELWSVFVAQNARESVPAPSLPREVWKQLKEEGHISGEPTEAQYQDLCRSYRESPSGPVLEILGRERLVVIAGDPGSGKSSLLKQCLYQWLKQAAKPDDKNSVPLWIELREFAEANRHEALDLLAYLSSDRSGFALDANQIHERLKAGNATLYIDGLDEIFDIGLRNGVIQQIEGIAARYSTAKIVVTTRIIGYEPERLRNAGFRHATLEDFDEKQVPEFVELWHKVAEPDPKEQHRLQQRMTVAIERSRAVRSLTGNPLLLTMMAILNRNQELPRDRVELYREASRVLLHDWDARLALGSDFDREEKEELLRRLANKMQDTAGGLEGNVVTSEDLKRLFHEYLTEKKHIDPRQGAKKLLAQLMERNFILCAAGGNRLGFVHRTFLEFYCADAWHKRLNKELNLEPLKDLFTTRWKNERWHEVLRLIAGLVEQNHAAELIKVLLQQDGRDYRQSNVLLAGECLNEIRNRAGLSSIESTVRNAVLAKVVSYDPPYYYDRWMSEEEVGTTRRAGVSLYISIWPSESKPWLQNTLADAGSGSILRQAAVQELARGWKDDPDTLPLLKDRVRSDEDGDVRAAAVLALARDWRDDPDTLPLLKDRARVDDSLAVQLAVVQELARGWKDDPDTLPWLKDCARVDGSFAMQLAAVQELARGWRDDPDTLPWLKDCARSDDKYAVRLAAVQELARGWRDDPDTLPLLKDRARSDEYSAVRRAAVGELARGWKDDPDTLPLLKYFACCDEDEFGRRAALRELARGWKDDPDTLPWLKDRARSDEDSAVRQAAVEELARGWKDDPDILPLLKDRARSDEDSA